MKMLNYSLRYLVEAYTPAPPKRPYSMGQFKLLCRLIKQKGITKDCFYKLLYEMYECHSIKQLSYEQMYHIVGAIAYLNISKWDL